MMQLEARSEAMTKDRIIIRVLAILLYLCLFSVVAVGQSGPVVQSVTPDAVPAGGPDAFITVKGSGFNASSVITIVVTNPIQNLSLPTTFIDAGTLQAVIPYRSIALPAAVFIRVNNADTGVSSLVPFTFTVYSREPPVVSSVDVSGAPAGTRFIRMTLTGSHLV
jgi:hypothetical protein